ncbi:hypothetical protein J5J10_08285 [Ciceribacter sp. L1K23]|uniref:hypothetical protein n=1 Tax=unclassified Ciceribacter TaxID=2628820 RepID=UPI001ABE7D18|nr:MULTISPECIES: hypothetical protein [unclassified Ciceribacter]MBO3760202.1 hypothetical protein [Ciceribacter sp. L1K22]MBR0555679.1 hypothetical protein [Ciceribacter sp. L1K23]
MADRGFAQDAFSTFKQLDGSVKMPKLKAFSPELPDALTASPAKSVSMEARLTEDGEAVEQGLSWRVFSPIPGDDGKLPLLASSEGGSADFQLMPGDYFVNVAFGRAGATKKLSVPQDGTVEHQVMVLDAGGLVLNAVSGADTRVPPQQLRFDVYAAEVQENGDRRLVLSDVKPNTIVRLGADTYHIVSEYGSVNAVVRADIKVEAGKLTEATIQHRAAQINFKLVSEAGGEAIADTAWSIVTAGGDIVGESVSAFPTLVLAEGGYTAIARNKDKIFQQDFSVEAGVNKDVEVLLGS